MARKPRVEFAGAVYHVMARGNERKKIFKDDSDRKMFLECLKQALNQYGLEIYCYCLMPNHYHLVCATPRANLSQAMRWLQTTYTIRFNRRHKRTGHLFQGRYKAQLVEADEYALWLVAYIHLNPVRIGVQKKSGSFILPREKWAEFDGYPWSSHRFYSGKAKTEEEWLSSKWLDYYGRGSQAQNQKRYVEYVGRVFGKEMESPWNQMQAGLVLGGAGLVEKAVRCIRDKKSTKSDSKEWLEKQDGNRVIQKAKQMAELQQDKKLRIWIRVRMGGEPMKALGRELGYKDGTGLLQVVKRLENKATKDQALAKKLKELKVDFVSCQ